MQGEKVYMQRKFCYVFLWFSLNTVLWHAMPHRGSRFLWNVGKFLWQSIASYPRRQYPL